MKRLIAILITAMLVFVVSCDKEQLEPTIDPNTPPAGELVGVQMSLKASPMRVHMADSETGTKTVTTDDAELVVTYGASPESKTTAVATEATEDEMAIKNLWVIQFVDDNTTSRKAVLVDQGLPADGTYSPIVYLMPSNGSGRLYIIANATAVITAQTYDETVLKALSITIASDHANGIETSGIPMLACHDGVITETNNSFTTTPITLERLLAKVVFTYDYTDFPSLTTPTVGLCNVSKNAYMNTAAEALQDGNFPDRNASINHFQDYSNTEGPTTRTWYIPENIKGINDAIEDVKNRTSGAMGAYRASYIKLSGSLDTPTIKGTANYEFMLGNVAGGTNVDGDNGNFNVERNTVYNITATIKGVGKNDPRVSIDQTNAENTAGISMSNSAIVVPTGSVGTAGANIARFNLRKIYEGNPKMMDLGSVWAGVTAKIVWQDVEGLLLDGEVTINTTDGTLDVKPSIPATTYGNAIVAAMKDDKILWSWHVWVTNYEPLAQTSTTSNTKYPTITNGREGETHTYGAEYMKAHPRKVIMDRNLGATTTYYTVSGDGSVPNDINATGAWGLLYQFGRKDPMPRTSGSSATSTTTQDTYPNDVFKITPIADAPGSKLLYSIENPVTFIYSGSAPFDWYATTTAGQNDNLWDNRGKKGVYDPCPDGWRVPQWNGTGTGIWTGTWGDFISASFTRPTGSGTYRRAGRMYKQGGDEGVAAWYPSSGYRTHSSGGLTNVGYYGYSWSSSISGASGVFLYFYTEGIDPSVVNRRASGFTVRCLQE